MYADHTSRIMFNGCRREEKIRLVEPKIGRTMTYFEGWWERESFRRDCTDWPDHRYVVSLGGAGEINRSSYSGWVGVHESNEVIRFRGENAGRELFLENLTKCPTSNQQHYCSQSLEMPVIGHSNDSQKHETMYLWSESPKDQLRNYSESVHSFNLKVLHQDERFRQFW